MANIIAFLTISGNKKAAIKAANLLNTKRFIGPPDWTRTSDQRIMSPLL